MGIRDNYKSTNDGNSREFDLLPAGYYTCELTAAVERERPWNGETETSLTFEVVEGAHASRRIFCQAPQRESMAWWMRMIWDGLGLKGAPWDGLPEDCPDSEIWANLTQTAAQSIGARCKVRLAHRNYDGKDGTEKTSADVKAIAPLPDACAAFTAKAVNPYAEQAATAPGYGTQAGNELPF